MILTRNFKIILSSFLCFFTSIFSILIFLVLSLPKSEPLSFVIKDIFIEVGKSTSIDYDINYHDAEVFFSVSNTSIAVIEENKVVALSEGETTLRGSATYNGQICYASCNIVVHSPPKQTYSVIIDIINEGFYENNTLFANAKTCFTMSIIDKDMVEQNIQDLIFDNRYLTQEFKYFYLKNDFEGVLNFYSPSINFYFEITVKKIQ